MRSGYVADVRSAYRFLEEHYGFKVEGANEDSKRPYYGGYVVYSSEATVVVIGLDRGVVLHPRIGRTKDREDHERIGELSLRLICEYLMVSGEIRRLLSSDDPKDLRQGLAELAEHSPGPGSSDETPSQGDLQSSVQARLARDAVSLERCGKPFLVGDFSNWLRMHEYRLGRAVAEHLASAERHGKYQSVDEIKAVFHRSAQYIEKLGRESGSGESH